MNPTGQRASCVPKGRAAARHAALTPNGATLWRQACRHVALPNLHATNRPSLIASARLARSVPRATPGGEGAAPRSETPLSSSAASAAPSALPPALRAVQAALLQPWHLVTSAVRQFWSRDGGVLLFLAVGAAMCAALVFWATGDAIKRGKTYVATVCFDRAPNCVKNTPVRLKGVQIGSVADIRPRLDHVQVTGDVDIQFGS